MSTPTVRISDQSHQLLKEIAEHTHQSMTEVLAKALDVYRRQLFFDRMNSGYAEMRTDPIAWEEHLAERKQWDATLMDGLDADEKWTENGNCLNSDQGNS